MKVNKKREYVIENEGCDDETTCRFLLTLEQYDFLNKVFSELNKRSKYGCQPRIKIVEMETYEETWPRFALALKQECELREL